MQRVFLLMLCAAYIQGSVEKLLDFNGAIGEMQHFGLPLPVPMAAAVIIFELTASAMVISGWKRWLGAVALAAFTVMATFLANRFWALPVGHERMMTENGFFEHIGLAGAFLLVAWLDWKGGRNA
ncbi:DoxX family protein [Pseudoduganella sp. RAF53_2]|uniref:DoxX family protein n=1 Tax=unclassified Pseudoduganella TaxID=2637179 RepID=UPI003F9762E5